MALVTSVEERTSSRIPSPRNRVLPRRAREIGTALRGLAEPGARAGRQIDWAPIAPDCGRALDTRNRNELVVQSQIETEIATPRLGGKDRIGLERDDEPAGIVLDDLGALPASGPAGSMILRRREPTLPRIGRGQWRRS
jgi:hypothetical protein